MADVLTNVGRNIVVGRLKGGITAGQPGAAEPNQIAWGTGTTTAAATQTALVTEAAEARITATTTLQLTSGVTDTYRAVGTLTNTVGGTTKAITEAGLFDTAKAASGSVPVGNMFIRSDFAAVNVANNDSLQLQWDWRLT